MLGRSWVEIDLKQIIKNYNIYKSALGDGQRIMAVVKADAYGHGAIPVSRALYDAGVREFAVSNLDEAIELRRAGIGGHILLLGYTPISLAQKLKEYDVTQTIVSEEYAKALADSGVKLKVQVAIDTGMNRIGLDASDPERCREVILKCAQIFELNGIFTHLCMASAEDGREFTEEQIAKFRTVAQAVSELDLPYVHCMNSAAGLWYNDLSDVVRLGIVMYGLKPDIENTLPDGIRSAFSWKSVVSMVKSIKAGDTVGYGRAFCAEKDMKIATLPTGYADGYSRALSNKGAVIIRGKKARILGYVCMDQMMVDVTDIEDVAMGDEAVLIGDGYDADDMAHDMGTIGYEVICAVSKRVPKVYLWND